MKVLLLMTGIFFAPQILAQDQCQRDYRHLQNTCGQYFSLKNRTLYSCLVRRDTCQTANVANNSQGCQQISQCMATHEDSFRNVTQDRTSCEYFWSQEHEMCHIRRRALAPKHHCPGRISLTSTIIDGLDGGIDGTFNCQGQATAVESAIERCQEQHLSFQRNCPQFYQEAIENYPVPSSYYLSHLSQDWSIHSATLDSSIDDRSRIIERQHLDPAIRPPGGRGTSGEQR